MVLDQYEKESEKAATIGKDPKAPEAPEPTIKDILADSKMSPRFGDFLQGAKEKSGVALRLKTGELEAGDFQKLEEYRKNFLGKMKQVDVVVKRLDSASIEQIAKKSPELQEILMLTGVEGVSGALRNQMYELAMTRWNEFENISKAFSTLDTYKKEGFKKLDEEVAGLCKKAGIDANIFAKISQETDDGKRAKAFEEEAGFDLRGAIRDWTKGMKPFGKNLSMFRSHKSTREWAAELSGKKGLIDSAMQQIKDNTGNIGKVLRSTIDADPKMRASLTREMLGEKRGKEPEPLTFKEMQRLSIETSEEKQEKAYKTRWETIKKSPKYIDASEASKNAQEEDFKEAEMERFREGKRGGFWMTIMEMFVRKMLNKVTA